MTNRSFEHNIVFRLLFPPVAGLIAYIVILMLFDSLNSLIDNFFSQEALFCIILTFAFTELFRMVILLLDKYLPFEKNYRSRLILQFIITMVVEAILITLLVVIYFILFVGYRSFRTELVTFNLVYLFFIIMINIYHVSIYNLACHHNLLFEKEKQFMTGLKLKLELFKRDINPEMLFNSLETLISLIHTDSKKADEYVIRLSKQYRYILESRQKELTGIHEEFESLKDLLFILNLRYQGNIILHMETGKNFNDGYLAPGTLNYLAEQIVAGTIITIYRTFHLYLQVEDTEDLIMKHFINNRLVTKHPADNIMNELNRTYKFFLKRTISIEEEDGYRKYRIPVIKIPEI